MATEYEHINDCWNALRECKTLEEVDKIIDSFPRWSGDWAISKDEDNQVLVSNTYYDKELEDEFTDEESLDIDFPDSEDDTFDSELDDYEITEITPEDCLDAINLMLSENSSCVDSSMKIKNAGQFKEQFEQCYKFGFDQYEMKEYFESNYKKIYKLWCEKGLQDLWNDDVDFYYGND